MAKAKKVEEKKLKYVVNIGYGDFYFAFDDVAEATSFLDTVISKYKKDESRYGFNDNIENKTNFMILTEERFEEKFSAPEDEENEEE